MILVSNSLYACMLICFSHVRLCDPVTVAFQGPLFMRFSRQEYWNGLLCPPPGDLPHPGIESAAPVAPVLQVDPLPLNHWGSPVLLLHE